MRRLPVRLAALALGAFGCGPSPPELGAAPAVSLDPASALDEAAPVLRIVIRNLGLPPAAVVLFSGELSDYYRGELRDGKVPASLRDRQVAAEAWVDEDDDHVVFAPAHSLVPGGTYSLAALGGRSLATLRVTDRGAPFADRKWPPHSFPRGGMRWVFCGVAGSEADNAPLTIDPGKVSAHAASGADSEGRMQNACFRLDLESNPGSGFGVPPPLLAGVALDPSAVDFVDEPSSSAPCPDGNVAAGPACIEVLDDRAVLRTTIGPQLLSYDVGERAELDVLSPASPFVVTGLVPSNRVAMRGTATDLLGREAPFAVEFETKPPMIHVVLNEVLANPLGSEPAQEWVEIVNDGLAAVDVGGFTLELSDGRVSIPAATLAPHTFALLVSERYAPASGMDVPPAPGTRIIRLPRLGLSNSGESLTLRARDGSVLSRFPPIAPPAAGVSVARRTPSALDSDASSFGPHAGEGASPGWNNDIGSP